MDQKTKEEIEKLVNSSLVFLFMKGNPEAAWCGFSKQVVQILQDLAVEFRYLDVLKHPQIRHAIKEYSNWPTIPQIYVAGEFIGGCDILLGMHASGELSKLLAKTFAEESNH